MEEDYFFGNSAGLQFENHETVNTAVSVPASYAVVRVDMPGSGKSIPRTARTVGNRRSRSAARRDRVGRGAALVEWSCRYMGYVVSRNEPASRTPVCIRSTC